MSLVDYELRLLDIYARRDSEYSEFVQALDKYLREAEDCCLHCYQRSSSIDGRLNFIRNYKQGKSILRDHVRLVTDHEKRFI